MTFHSSIRKYCAWIAGFLLLVGHVETTVAQEIPYSAEAERLFAEAIALYERQEYANASAAFGRVLQIPGVHQRTTAALIMRAKADLQAGNLSGAQMSVNTLLREFPSSDYRADAEYTLGLIHAKSGMYDRALKAFLECWRSIAHRPALARVQASVLTALDSTVDRYVSIPHLQQLLAEMEPGSEQEFLYLKLAKKQLDAGHYNAAVNTFDYLRRVFPASNFPQRFNDLRRMMQGARSIAVAVVVPLMKGSLQVGREKEVGAGLLDGVTLAFEEYGVVEANRKISLLVRDSQNDPAATAAIFNELAGDSSVIGVIGPAFSSEAIAGARVANEKSLPAVTPTANANGIAASGPYMFQANPDLETRARAMAAYAVNTLGMKRVAVLASREPSSKALADAFGREAILLGANLVTTEWYERGTTDLTQQMNNLRRKAAGVFPYIAFNGRLTQRDILKLSKLGVPQRVLDSLALTRSVVSAVPLLGDDAGTKLIENGIPFTTGHPAVDSLHHIITTLDGLYCPINSPTEIGVVSSQVAYFGIATTLLGSGEWNNLAELNANQRYTPGIVFESDSYTESAEYREFDGRFTRRFGRSPNRNNLYGYDVAKMFLHVLEQGVATREQLRSTLTSLRGYKSLHSNVSFVPRRVNAWLHILRYADGAIRRVAEVEVR